MAQQNLFKLTIVTPEITFFDKNVYMITIKIDDGYVGVLRGHIPFIASIRPCVFEVRETTTSVVQKGIIGNGLIYVKKDFVKVTTNQVVWMTDIDKKDAEERLAQINEHFSKTNSNIVKSRLGRNKEYFELLLKN